MRLLFLPKYQPKCQRFIKFGFSEKATKFEKNLSHTFDKHRVLCAQQRTCQKVNEDF